MCLCIFSYMLISCVYLALIAVHQIANAAFRAAWKYLELLFVSTLSLFSKLTCWYMTADGYNKLFHSSPPGDSNEDSTTAKMLHE